MDTNILHRELITKRQKLQAVTGELKLRFLGLDSIIDDVTSLMLPWYVFPEAQRRPTVINLWGLTGSGKTALVQALVELLDHKKFYTHIDMGEFDSDSAAWIKNVFTDDLSFFDGKPALLCLDEFQFARTIDASNNELGKDKLRVIWELLDSGKIEYVNQDTYSLYRADNCLRRLEKLIYSDVAIERGIVTTNVEVFIEVFGGFYFDSGRDQKIKPDYFLSFDFIRGMYNLFDEAIPEYEIQNRIMNSGLADLITFMKEGMHDRPAIKTLDLSRSLIFVLGNLDEAYSMSHNMNPDINADEFHEQTTKITLADIKRALRRRFRPEQIARLGNNHVIYRSFNSAQFRMLIRIELDRVRRFVIERFGWVITFDETVVDIVYAEGVFPAQGTRPVLTTVKNLIESRVTSLIVSILEYQLRITDVVWRYADGQFFYVLKNSMHIVTTMVDKASLKLENLRKSIDPQLQAHIAVHEAGHAVLAALTFRIAPSLVVSRTASDAEGFCMVTFPKGPLTRETLRKDIITTLGGFVAERMIFGEDRTSSGVYSDIEEASALANKAVRKFAMGSDPIHMCVEMKEEENAFITSSTYTAEAIRIIRECEHEAEVLLKRNKLLLLKIAEYLTTNSKMTEDMIADYVITYGAEPWLATSGLIHKDDYYQFNSTLQSHLSAMAFDQEIETLMTIREE